jgi:uncharacterized glyoxalase superfamily protein PhnB
MKILKTLAIAGVATMLVAGSAFAYNGNSENNTNAKIGRMKSMSVSKFSNMASKYKSLAMNSIEVVAEVTGKSVEEVKELCASLKEDGKTLVTYLEEQNLLEDVKAKLISNAEERLNKLVEEGRLNEDQLSEKLASITTKINDEEFKLFGGIKASGFMNMKDNVLELTGLSKEDFVQVCKDLKEEGKTLVDYLKDQGLYEEWKTNLISEYENKLDLAVENERITEERAAELKEKLEQRIEDGKALNLGIHRGNFKLNKKDNSFNASKNILDITGLDKEELKDLCAELKEEGKTIVDYLKDEGLFDEWNQSTVESFTERIQKAVDAGKLTPEKADEMISNFEDKLENSKSGLRGFNKGHFFAKKTAKKQGKGL